MEDQLTKAEFLGAFTALALALHENKVLALDQLTDSIEGTLARRKVNLGAENEELEFLLGILTGLHRLKNVVPDN